MGRTCVLAIHNFVKILWVFGVGWVQNDFSRYDVQMMRQYQRRLPTNFIFLRDSGQQEDSNASQNLIVSRSYKIPAYVGITILENFWVFRCDLERTYIVGLGMFFTDLVICFFAFSSISNLFSIISSKVVSICFLTSSKSALLS